MDNNRSVKLLWMIGFILPILAGCAVPWNNPYPPEHEQQNILYSSFSERPKHLDPVRAYSSNEYAFIAQIYEPPLQYHYLKRPYQLIPLTAKQIPKPQYFDAEGNQLPEDTPIEQIAFSEYRLVIHPGIQYQPHPALAQDAQGNYRYHQISPKQLAKLHVLTDFTDTGTRELTADDYLYQIKRLAAPHWHSPIAGVLGEYILGFQELGKQIQTAYQAEKERTGQQQPYLDLRSFDLAGAQVVDRYQLKIRLKGKYPQFVYWLTMPFFAPMPWEAERFYAQPGLAERNITLDWYPIGTGPFMLTENNPNLQMVLSRNPYFHGETYPTEGMPGDAEAGRLVDAGKPMPFIDQAVYRLEKEDIPYWNKFLQGYYDVSGIASDSFDQAIQFGAQGEMSLTEPMRQKDIQLLTAVTATTYYFGFNWLDPVVGGSTEQARLLRQAIAIAVDIEEFIAIFLNGRGIAAQSPLPPGIFGHRPGKAGINPFVYRWQQGKAVRRPLADAKQRLTQAGYPDGRDRLTGKPLILHFDTSATGPDGKARLNWMRKQFAKLGIQLVIRATDYNRFQEKARNGTAQIFMWGWNADYPDPENFFFLLYGPNSQVEHGGQNSANYQNPKFDALFKQMKNQDNRPERQTIIDQMTAIVWHDSPWIWGFHPQAVSLYHSWYQNAVPNLMANNTLKYKRIDPQERALKRQAWNPPILWPIYLLLAVLMLSALPAIHSYRRRERSAAR